MSKALNSNVFTYKDYLKLPEEERGELIDGQFFSKAYASPSCLHQKTLLELALQIGSFLKTKETTCELYVAPFDVLLALENETIEDVKNVVQPDLLVICDPQKLTEKGCLGAPDLIIEIVSPTSYRLDYVLKLNLYDKFHVKEYWIVNPETKTVLIYRQDNDQGFGEPEKYTIPSFVSSSVLAGFTISTEQIFKD
ncbi:Uma2 family endonuclease [Carboxydothermus ferrireducens]|uniref:Uma2 family endonuclease n=1 Tax=Carboxydothermus ferrireducens DSM 11255 TaxID=1119529 RepID=A0ABX2R9D2_9THEO|nr:Uma2 family endonuclease [Carboxydothermus ferrireducens]NYE57786.1 Uma2 family endonuclease [Carboxydothermus ferrireducens DSM 11255]